MPIFPFLFFNLTGNISDLFGKGKDMNLPVCLSVIVLLRVFTKVLKPIVATLRFRGTRLVVFIDDILIIASSVQQGRGHLSEAIALLESLGFTINFAKSNIMPTQNIVYLGFIINSVSMKLFLPRDKLIKLFLYLSGLLHPQNRRFARLHKSRAF